VPVWWWETEKNGQGKGRTGAACKIQQGYRALQWFELEGRPGALTHTRSQRSAARSYGGRAPVPKGDRGNGEGAPGTIRAPAVQWQGARSGTHGTRPCSGLGLVNSPMWNAVVTPHWVRPLDAPHPPRGTRGPGGPHVFIYRLSSASGPARTSPPYLRYPACFLHLHLLPTLQQVDQKRRGLSTCTVPTAASPAHNLPRVRTRSPTFTAPKALKNHEGTRCQNCFSLH